MFLKILFFLISFFTGICGIFALNKLPSERLSVRQNYLSISLFSTVGAGIDFIMFWIVVGCIQPGDYGTGVETVAFILTLLLYGIPCILTSFFLKKRLKTYNQNRYSLAQISGLNVSVLFKAIFVFVAAIWLLEK